MSKYATYLLSPLLCLHLLELVVVPLVLVDLLLVKVQDFFAHAVQEVLIVRYLRSLFCDRPISFVLYFVFFVHGSCGESITSG